MPALPRCAVLMTVITLLAAWRAAADAVRRRETQPALAV